MSLALVINGVTYDYPEVDDVDWGPDATDWAAAVTSGLLQKAGGLFQLLAEVDFGTGFGVKALYFKSRTANPADAGQIRLARADVINFRNQANSGNNVLGVDSSDNLTYNGSPVGFGLVVADTSTIDLTFSAGTLTADIVALSITNAKISNSAAIAYSKLALSNSIVNADINASAAIAYSKLNLSNSIVNADVNSAAAIAFSKLAALTSAHILVGSAGNVATDVAMSGDISITNAGVTAYAGTVPLNKGGTGQTTKAPAFDALQPMTTGGDLIYGGASGTGTRLANGTAAQVLTSAGTTLPPTWATPRQPNLVIQSKTANYTVLTTDDLLIGSGSAFTFALFTAVGNSGKVLRFNNIDATAATNTVTVDANGSETINGQLTFVLTGQYQSLTIVSDGANWQILDFDPAGEVLAGASNSKTATATDRYPAFTGNSLTLTPGTWELFGNIYFTNGGVSPSYTTCSILWGAANGADTNVSPADISTAANLTVLSVAQNFMGAGANAANNCVPAPSYVVRVTASVTIYLDAYVTLGTAANSRLFTYQNAKRIQ